MGVVALGATIKNMVVGHNWDGGMWPEGDTTLRPSEDGPYGHDRDVPIGDINFSDRCGVRGR